MKIGFIGAGNMGFAMINRLAEKSSLNFEKINVFDVDREKLDRLNCYNNVFIQKSQKEVVIESDVIIIAVKPIAMDAVLNSLKEHITDNKIIVSIAVGIPIKFFKKILGNNKKIIRTMPNTPAMIGEGVTIISPDDLVLKNELNNVIKVFEQFGIVQILDEKLMNEVTALTGSSPAYVYMFIEAMADAAVLSGIPREIAYKLAAQSIVGSSKMVIQTSTHPAQLKDQVCSPAGTTIEAVRTLEMKGFRSSIIEAMFQCTKKAKEISNSFD